LPGIIVGGQDDENIRLGGQQGHWKTEGEGKKRVVLNLGASWGLWPWGESPTSTGQTSTCSRTGRPQGQPAGGKRPWGGFLGKKKKGMITKKHNPERKKNSKKTSHDRPHRG